jgi:hypothetical protein
MDSVDVPLAETVKTIPPQAVEVICVNLSALRLPSGEINELFVIEALVLLQYALLKSSEYCIKLVLLGSKSKLICCYSVS